MGDGLEVWCGKRGGELLEELMNECFGVHIHIIVVFCGEISTFPLMLMFVLFFFILVLVLMWVMLLLMMFNVIKKIARVVVVHCKRWERGG